MDEAQSISLRNSAQIVDMTSLLQRFEKNFNVRVFSREFEIIFSLFRNGAMSAGELVADVSASQAACYIISKNMVDRGMVVVKKGESDRRQVIYELDPKVKEALEFLALIQSYYIRKFPG
ncbi:MAG: MarR family transcriptional regulator [Sphingomonadales bacterium]